MAYDVAVDIGGTFTDLVAVNHETSDVRYTKSPTTYDNFVRGILECLRKVKVDAKDVRLISHGTTLVINALIQRRGAKTALVTTRGFRDVLEIARGNRPDPFDLYYSRGEPLIPRELRFELAERIGPHGQVVSDLDEEGLKKLAARLKEQDVEAVAVSFLNAYANAKHELRAEELLRTHLPGVYVTRGTDLCQEWYEYERCSTVSANAYVGPQVSGYIGTLRDSVRELGFTGTVFMMGSNGGVLSLDRSCRQPIALIESGPIGGCIGAGAYAKELGYANVIAFDMGGTTAKSALVEEGKFSVEQTYYAGGYVRGFPLKSPVIDIIEVGAGGGSIAWLDPQNRLHVGPRSAGSTPGPVCYGNGGAEPTVTDANLILGRLAPDRFLGGEMQLDVEAARTALLDKVGRSLGYAGESGAVALAKGIVSIATVIMAGEIRKQTVERGRDPRDFILFSYGGNGPLHAVALARELSIPTVVIPPEPGNFSASGMLIADGRLDLSRTYAGPLDEPNIRNFEQVFAAMEAEAAGAISDEIGPGDIRFERAIEMRYRGQRHNLKISLRQGEGLSALRASFDENYKRRYGHSDSRTPIEIQTLHLSAAIVMRHPDLKHMTRKRGGGTTIKESRKVYFDSDIALDTPIYDRFSLTAGFAAEGPAVIEEYGSTTIVWPGDRFAIGAFGEIRIDCGNAQ